MNTFKLVKLNQSWIDKAQLEVIYPSRLASSNFVVTTPMRLTQLSGNKLIQCNEPKVWSPEDKFSSESIVTKNHQNLLNVDCSEKYVCDIVSCTLGPMRTFSIDLKYYSRLNLTAIESISGELKYEDIIYNIHLYARILDNHVIDSKTIMTNIHYLFQEVATVVEQTNLFWPIFFGILIGLLILILVSWACYKFGFFKRTRPGPTAAPEELDQLNE